MNKIFDDNMKKMQQKCISIQEKNEMVNCITIHDLLYYFDDVYTYTDMYKDNSMPINEFIELINMIMYEYNPEQTLYEYNKVVYFNSITRHLYKWVKYCMVENEYTIDEIMNDFVYNCMEILKWWIQFNE